MDFTLLGESLSTTQSILIAIAVGIPVGIITGTWVKRNVKSGQEIIFEENREQILRSMLSQIYYPYHQMGSILAIFERRKEFSSKKNFSDEFTDNEIFAFESYRKWIYENLKKLPRFHDCSTFIHYNEYVTIKKYILSSIFFYPIDGSAVGKKNMMGFNHKFFLDHALFAKQIIEMFKDKGLDTGFVNDWTDYLKKEGLLDPNFKKKPLEPGDMVPIYEFDSEIL